MKLAAFLISGLFLVRLAIPTFAQTATGRSMDVSRAPRESLQDMETAGIKMSFDVVSVKLNNSGARDTHSNIPLGPGVPFPRTGGLFTVTNMPLPSIIVWAFDLPGDQQLRINSQLPKWALADRFDIEAKTAGNPDEAEMELMVQSLLADRFKLAVHTETKEGPIFALEMVKPGKLGPQLKAHVRDPSCSESDAASAACESGLRQMPPSVPGLIRFVGQNVPVSIIAKYLPLTSVWGTGLDRPVVDKTGLSGDYDFTIEFVRQFDPDQRTQQPTQNGATFIEALRDQLGLKLDSQTGSVSEVIIDHVEEPSPN